MLSQNYTGRENLCEKASVSAADHSLPNILLQTLQDKIITAKTITEYVQQGFSQHASSSNTERQAQNSGADITQSTNS